jgi:hypothetical protein
VRSLPATGDGRQKAPVQGGLHPGDFLLEGKEELAPVIFLLHRRAGDRHHPGKEVQEIVAEPHQDEAGGQHDQHDGQEPP